MFTKTVHIALGMLLLITTAGLTIEKHYCGSRLVSVSLFGDPDPCCDADSGCCHNDSRTFVLKADFTASQSTAELEPFMLDVVAHPAVFHNLDVRPGHDAPKHSGLSPPALFKTELCSLQTYRL